MVDSSPRLAEGLCPFSETSCSEVRKGQITETDLFFAYSVADSERVQCIQGAIERVRKDPELDVSIVDWTELDIEGGVIFCAICHAIRLTSCVVADITDLNFNVMFELGFAVGSGRRIWPLIHESASKGPHFATLDSISTVGYRKYNNSKKIAEGVVNKKPWERSALLPQPVLGDGTPTATQSKVLFLKSTSEDEASLRIDDAV